MPIRRPGALRLALLFVAGISPCVRAQAAVLKAHVSSYVDNRAATSFINVPGGTLRIVPEAPTDVWLLFFSAHLKSTSASQTATQVQYLVDGTVRGVGGIQNQNVDQGAAWMHFDRITGVVTPQVVQVQIRDALGGAIATIEDLQIIAFKLPAGADFQFAETPASPRAVAAGVWNDFESLSFTPSSFGSYLVFSLATFSENPGADGVGIRTSDPLGNFWPNDDSGTRLGHAANERLSLWSFFAVRRQNLGAVPQTYRIQANGATGGSTVDYTRLMAFRTDIFDDYQQVESLGVTGPSTSTTPVVKGSVTTNVPPGFRDYVVFQNLFVRSTLAGTNEKLSGFERDNLVQTSYAHSLDNADHRVSFGFVDAFTTDQSVLLENTFSTSNAAFPVAAKESTIFVLRFPTADPTRVRGLATNGHNAGGLAWADFNEDDCLDVLVNTSDPEIATRLYLQGKAGSCTGQFQDVTACLAPGMVGLQAERSAIWGDFDNDGAIDFARNDPAFIDLFRNNGPGLTTGPACGAGVVWSQFGTAGAPTQTLVTADLPVPYTTLNSERLAFIDYDADGDLDLFADNHDEGMILFGNTGGVFSVVAPATVGFPTSGTDAIDMGSFADMDVDGDVDFVVRTETGNDIYENLGGTFTPVLSFDQPAVNTNRGSTAWCDFDDDGDFDLFWTDLGTNQVWEQTGFASRSFTARGVPAGITGDIEGVDCDDIDNDGDVDLALTSDGDDYFFRNDGAFTFTDVTPARLGLQDGEGLAFADFDRDGDVDLLINQTSGNELWENTTNDSNYLVVRALHDLGGGVTRDAIGATITLIDCAGQIRAGVRDVNGGSGFGTQKPAYVHFGLPTSGTPSGPGGTYIVRVKFVGGAIVGKAVVPSALGGYQLVTVTDSDANDVAACATSVSLLDFDAVGKPGAVELTWATASESKNLGFYLERADGSSGPYERLGGSFVPGLGSSPEGARYRFVDTNVVPGHTYYYRLLDIESTGVVTPHGPAGATPLETGASPPAAPRESETAEIVYGRPGENALTIRSVSENTVVLELETRGFRATAGGESGLTLAVPGFVDQGPLPVRRAMVPAVAGRGVEVSWVRAVDEVRFPWQSGSLAPTEIAMLPSGTVRYGRRRGFDEGKDAGWEPARLVEVLFQGDAKKALVELSPFRANDDEGSLSLFRRIEVRLRFTGRVSRERSLGGRDRGRREPPSRRGADDVWARLATVAPGLYAVPHEALPRLRSRATTGPSLLRNGEPVAFHVEPRERPFARGSVLYFVSAGEASNPYGPEAVFELVLGGEGTRMEVRSAAPGFGGDAGTFHSTVGFSDDDYYFPSLLEAPDPWFWDVISSGETRSYTFDAPEAVGGSGIATLRVRLQGSSDLPASPDHHVTATLNGVPVGEVVWNGKHPASIAGAIDPGLVLADANELRLESLADTEALYSVAALEGFELDYPRSARIAGEDLKGRWDRTGRASVLGAERGLVALDVTEGDPVWLSNAARGVAGWDISVAAGRTYLLADAGAVRLPSVRSAGRDTLRAARRADFVILGPNDLLDEVSPLARRRREEGLAVEVVSTEEIYESFGHGEPSPEAIKSFLVHAYHHWDAPSYRYVLLVGDGHYDFEDHLASGAPNHVPPLVVETSFLRTASDPAYAAVNGEDSVPDVAIGRIPARTSAEVGVYVKKVLAYESDSTSFLSSPIALVADNPDRAGDFTAQAEAARAAVGSLPVEIEIASFYLERMGAPEVRDAVDEAFTRGSAIVSYVGHGGIELWADENLLDTAAVASLPQTEARLPLVLTMNCLNGYFHFPHVDALAESLVLAKDKGAVAAFAPSGLSLSGPASTYHQAMLRALLGGGSRRLGDAVVDAQVGYAETGELPDLLAVYHLFGDPTLRLR